MPEAAKGTHGVKENHPDCPPGKPHATVVNSTGEKVACHATKQEAQDLALTLNVPDATPVTPGAVIQVGAAAPADGLELADVTSWEDVELVAAGEWDLSTGTSSFSTADLQAAVGAAQCPAIGNPVLKLGHTDPRFNFDGEPSIGWAANMRLSDNQTKIIADLAGMPSWLAGILPSAYPRRSIEATWDLTCQNGHVHPFVITAVALLGVTPPGVGMIGSLSDVAALYGADVEAAAAHQPTRTPGVLMPPDGSRALAGGTVTTIDDVRREYYEEAPWSRWIIEIQIGADGPVLIVSDDSTGALYRVPVKLDANQPGEVEFGPDTEVLVSYVDAPDQTAEAKAGLAFPPGRTVAAAWGNRTASREGVAAAWSASTQVSNLGDDPSKSQINALFALPGDTKSDSKLPHHEVSSDGKVGAADVQGCQAAIGAINGSRGGLSGVSSDDLKKAYNHLAAHLRAAGEEPAEFNAAAAEAAAARLERLAKIRAAIGSPDADESTTELMASLDALLDQASDLASQVDKTKVPAEAGQVLDLVTAAEAVADQLMELLGIFDPDDTDNDDIAAAAAMHPYSGEHSHPHSAFGSQGSDATHDHMHNHSGDGVHNHDHTPPSTSAAQGKAAGTAGTEGAPEVEFTQDQLAAIRAKLGKKDDDEVTADDIAAAFTATPKAGEDGPVGKPDEEQGVYLVEASVIDGWRKRAESGDQAVQQLRRNERDMILAAAIRDGKFPQSRLDHWQRAWEHDPEGTRAQVASLASGLVPVGGPVGAPGVDPDLPGDFEDQQAYRRLYPEDFPAGAKGGATRG